MPKTDYTDPEISFPRLEVELFTIDGETYFANAWLWGKAGGVRRSVMSQEHVGSIKQAHTAIEKCAEKHGSEVGPDDITIRE
jgi:hypothetical protein